MLGLTNILHLSEYNLQVNMLSPGPLKINKKIEKSIWKIP